MLSCAGQLLKLLRTDNDPYLKDLPADVLVKVFDSAKTESVGSRGKKIVEELRGAQLYLKARRRGGRSGGGIGRPSGRGGTTIGTSSGGDNWAVGLARRVPPGKPGHAPTGAGGLGPTVGVGSMKYLSAREKK